MFAGEGRSQAYTDFRVPRPLPSGGALVLGVVGGWERWDQDNRGVGRTAARLRGKLGDGVWVETVENHKLALGVRLINEAFATATNGRLLILGQSLGGSAAVRLARYCERRGIPVDLLITIDSVGWRDRRIPRNVRAAANLYQRDAIYPLGGNPRIEAEDPARTRILFNRRYFYRGRRIAMAGEPWIRRWWLAGHLKMEYDEEPWLEVERLIRESASPGRP